MALTSFEDVLAFLAARQPILQRGLGFAVIGGPIEVRRVVRGETERLVVTIAVAPLHRLAAADALALNARMFMTTAVAVDGHLCLRRVLSLAAVAEPELETAIAGLRSDAARLRARLRRTEPSNVFSAYGD